MDCQVQVTAFFFFWGSRVSKYRYDAWKTSQCVERGGKKRASFHVLRWHCKRLAWVCSHRGLAITDSQYPLRIPLHFLGFQPLHTIHSNFISNCLCDIEQHEITSRCQQLQSQYIMNKLSFISHTASVAFLSPCSSSPLCIHASVHLAAIDPTLLASPLLLFISEPITFHFLRRLLLLTSHILICASVHKKSVLCLSWLEQKKKTLHCLRVQTSEAFNW